MTFYKIPNEYYFRLHHPRPRFKSNIENVLIYMASEITLIGVKPISAFNHELNKAIRRFGDNLNKKEKTINNWRTEIAALFSFIEHRGEFLAPSRRAIELANHQDLVKFFKLFCYHFQYPGGFLKPHINLKLLENNVNFRPATYILNMLNIVEQEDNIRAGITKAEATHCIFNDLRVTRDGRSFEETWKLIIKNRKDELRYDWSGDVIRYAGDILDYLVQANLMYARPDGKYYINHVEDIAIQRFLDPIDEFDYYNNLSDVENVTLEEIRELELQWISYFNTERDDSFFNTNILALMTDDQEKYFKLKSEINLDRIIEEGGLSTTSGIGSVGESLVLNHEKKRISIEGRADLAHLIKLIPAIYAVGYDINSREYDERHRFVEVKTTASSMPIHFNRFHLTSNEWAAAETHTERYFVYRLMVTKAGTKLYLIQDPVGEYKRGNLSAVPRNGMDITFDPQECGEEVQLII